MTDFNIPQEVRQCLAGARFEVSGRINPFYLRGDFDGDGKIDYAVLITAVGTQEKGLAVCGTTFSKAAILGAGSTFHAMKDLDFDAWHVYPKGPVQRGVEAGAPPMLKGEALLLEWSERASGLAYWDGKAFRWYQQGD